VVRVLRVLLVPPARVLLPGLVDLQTGQPRLVAPLAILVSLVKVIVGVVRVGAVVMTVAPCLSPKVVMADGLVVAQVVAVQSIAR
jgi:hypothetical protein